MKTYSLSQSWLRRKYQINRDTPLHGYDDYTRDLVDSRFKRLGSTAVYAYTSGSTKEPKKIAYNRKRLRKTRLVFIDSFFRYLALLPKHRSLFIFSSFEADQTLTQLLLHESGLPPYISGLQAPHRVQNHPAIRQAARIYGETAVRLWLLVISNPGLIYATNPSVIATFLHELYEKWQASTALIADYVNRPESILRELRMIHKRIATNGSCERLKGIASSLESLPVGELFPRLQGFSCWDGGYVQPFIEQIRKYLPQSHYRHLPMYSMSTETVETVAGIKGNQAFFVPLVPGVLYEFIEEEKADQPSNVLQPNELIAGKLYTMVISDGYGLRRYQTEDLFECMGMISGIPDLRFARRRNLSYSFTGEKLTAEQLKLAYSDVESYFPELSGQGFLTCFPSKPAFETIPRYRLIFVQTNGTSLRNCKTIASRIEEKLCEYNCEFKLKIQSHRLGHLTLESVPIRDFVRRLSSTAEGSSWGSQTKILPLYIRLWEALDL